MPQSITRYAPEYALQQSLQDNGWQQSKNPDNQKGTVTCENGRVCHSLAAEGTKAGGETQNQIASFGD